MANTHIHKTGRESCILPPMSALMVGTLRKIEGANAS